MQRITHALRSRLGLLGAALALSLALLACGGAAPTPSPIPPTPTPTPTATPLPTPTSPPVSASPSPRRAGSATPNPAAVTSAFANLQRLDSYHLEINATGLDKLLPLGIGNQLTVSTDYYKGDQHTIVTDSAGTTQEAYKVGGKNYLVTNGQASEVSTLPLIFTLPDLLYLNLTAPGVTTFTAAGTDQVNGRATTKYVGTGDVAALAANPLLATMLKGTSGPIDATIWVDTQGGYLVAGDITLTMTAPQPATAKLRLDVTKVGQVGPITLPR